MTMLKMLCAVFFVLIFENLAAISCDHLVPINKFVPQYAKHFEISYYQDFKIVQVDEKKYILTNRSERKHCDNFLEIKTPIKRAVFTSTTYLPSLLILKQEFSLVGFQEKKYIYSNSFNLNNIKDFSFDMKTEEIIKVHPDIVMAYENRLFQGKLEKLYKDFNISLILNKDSEENSPLARAEWIIFIASFYNLEDVAIKNFNNIRDHYLNLKESVRRSQRMTPKILLGDIQNGKWVFAGAQSDLGQLVRDAGGELVLKVDSKQTQSISLEEILKNKIKPDIWLTHNTWTNMEIIKKNRHYSGFEKVITFNNNLKLNKKGANDYWEMGMQRPDLMLSDLISIFYNQNKPLNWYKKLE